MNCLISMLTYSACCSFALTCRIICDVKCTYFQYLKWFVWACVWSIFIETMFCFSSSVNFKEPEAVRALTCTLLKEDFGLTIQIPLERLIPTVPLRLNYIHWVEDLIDGQKQPRRGIDIGTLHDSFISNLCNRSLFLHHVVRTLPKNWADITFLLPRGFPVISSVIANEAVAQLSTG